MRLLVMSLGGALMICVIFLARLLLQNRTHRGVWLLLWGLVLVRLLVPLVPEAPSSIFNLPLFRQPQAAVTETVQLPSKPVATMPVTEAPKTAPTLTMANIPVFVWAAVAVGVLLYFVISRLRAMLKGKANRVLSVCMTVLLSAVLLCVCCTGQMPLKASAAPAPALQPDPAVPVIETEQPTEAPALIEAPTEAQPAETEIAPTVEPTEAPAETPTEPAAAEAPAKPTEAPAPTEPQPTESAPTEPVPTEAPTQPTEPAPTELPQPTEPASQALPTPEPTNQLPTSYSIAGPGSITLHVGETRYCSLQSISILSFSCSGDLYVDALTVGPYDSFTGCRQGQRMGKKCRLLGCCRRPHFRQRDRRTGRPRSAGHGDPRHGSKYPDAVYSKLQTGRADRPRRRCTPTGRI